MGREAAVMDWEQCFPFLREKGHVVSLVGGGGKTTLLYALSVYCAAKGWRVLTSTTTHIRKPLNVPWIAVGKAQGAEMDTSPKYKSVNEKTQCENVAGESTAWENARNKRDRLWQQETYVVAGTPAPHEKLTILPKQILNEWILDADITFLEADGAKRHPCKFPAAHEPVILPQSDIVVAVAGLSALYRPLKEVCFRAELVCKEWNREIPVPISREDVLTPEILAWLLGSEKGGTKNTAGRSFLVVLNQADTPKQRKDGRKILEILKKTYGIYGILTSFSESERNQERENE